MRVLFLHNNAPAHLALATQKKLAYLGLQSLDHQPYSPDLAPLDYQLFSGLKKNGKKIIFCPTWRSLLPRTRGWTDSFLNFF
jgi:transposase